MEDKRKWDNIDGRKKAAIVVLALGREASSAVIKKMDERDVEEIVAEISSLGPVPAEVQHRILGEYAKVLESSAQVKSGGVDMANELLESA
ncbi:MAG TPA: flagellar motor switch protein FliG, partial [bacterium]|nr:flagellar motor switch protein FliG [bacterium]